jgi:hypothetical protein
MDCVQPAAAFSQRSPLRVAIPVGTVLRYGPKSGPLSPVSGQACRLGRMSHSHVTLLLLLASLLVSFTHPARGDLVSDTPVVVANYLASSGLATRAYKALDPSVPGTFSASSPYQGLPSTGAMKNNLAYYCEGTATKVTRIYLVLNVNSPADAASAHTALVEAATVLCKAALGKDMPAAIRDTLLKGSTQQWETGPYSLRSEKDTWPTGLSYSLKFEIKTSS